LFHSIEVLNWRKKKHLISLIGKKKFKRILVEGEKFSESCLQMTSSLFHGGELVSSEPSEVFKGFKEHDYENYG